MPRRRAASDARSNSLAMSTSRGLIEAKFTAQYRRLMLDLRHGGQVVAVDKGVSRVLKGGQ